MIITLSLLTIFILFILVLIPANHTIKLHNVSQLGFSMVFIISFCLFSYPMCISTYFEPFSHLIISLPSLAYSFSFLLDNLSLLFIILSTFLGFIVVMISRNIQYRLKEKYILLFLILLLLIQCFAAIEIIFFYLCFEALLIPIYSIIGVWGSQKEKIFAANQFFLYTLFGSFFMLTAIILLSIFTGSTNILILKGYVYSSNLEKILFWLFFLSFAVKIPMIPVHLWLPKAHVEAPTTGSVLLAGILLKLGSYGFLRILLFLFPKASFYFLPIILSLALISIILASFTVIRQIDLKRIIAYSSIAHMNYLVSALFVKNLFALTGSLLLQIAHGLSSSALFLIIGLLYERYKSRNIFYYRGLVIILPFICFFFFIFSLANLAFPSTINFVSEMLIFFGLFSIVPSIAILSLSGIFLSAVYSFILFTRLSFGPASSYIRVFFDITRREFYTLLPLAFLVYFLGLFPDYLTSYWTFFIQTWFTDQDILFTAYIPLCLVPRLLTFEQYQLHKDFYRLKSHLSTHMLDKVYTFKILWRFIIIFSSIYNHIDLFKYLHYIFSTYSNTNHRLYELTIYNIINNNLYPKKIKDQLMFFILFSDSYKSSSILYFIYDPVNPDYFPYYISTKFIDYLVLLVSKKGWDFYNDSVLS